MSGYQALKISDSVYWVGAVDWNIRDFHGYLTKRGSSYNAYLIIADKITLIDTVKAPFIEEMFARISSVVAPDKIDYIISNHSEIDHTGALKETIRRVNPEKVFASKMGVATLSDLLSLEYPLTAVADGETLSLGNKELVFIETKMLHWPDSMFSYLPCEKVLFSQDAFGMHLASSFLFADEIEPAILEYEAATYYANILLPYSPLVLKLLDRVTKMGLVAHVIAPDHGPIWRKNLNMVLEKYRYWASQNVHPKAVIVYDTMWGSTETMARHIALGISDTSGCEARLLRLDAVHRSEVAYELLGAGALVVGSATLNNNVLPRIADVMTYLKGLRPLNKIGQAFGSYGWSGEAPQNIQQMLVEMKVAVLDDPITAKHKPAEDILEACVLTGKKIAQKLK
ncbi:MAG: flavodoxin domain-containing protein [Deltaproteobacteria bacterium]|nr:flavodoxin domain-containing protein [Deltaproteobacteria bacterium]